MARLFSANRAVGGLADCSRLNTPVCRHSPPGKHSWRRRHIRWAISAIVGLPDAFRGMRSINRISGLPVVPDNFGGRLKGAGGEVSTAQLEPSPLLCPLKAQWKAGSRLVKPVRDAGREEPQRVVEMAVARQAALRVEKTAHRFTAPATSCRSFASVECRSSQTSG